MSKGAAAVPTVSGWGRGEVDRNLPCLAQHRFLALKAGLRSRKTKFPATFLLCSAA